MVTKAGLEIDGDKPTDQPILFKQVGKVAALRKHILDSAGQVDLTIKKFSQTSMAHTRWATHGQPSTINCHPHRSDKKHEFTIVHNGIITNYKEIRLFLEKRGYAFESDTDTEVVAVLTKYLWDEQHGKHLNFTALAKTVIKELEGAFALVFKSVHYPDEVVICKRGSPVLIGVKTEKKLKVRYT
jgi:glucosamine--fructose-6-phosphate aminotransferase (isomerizing)